jgi:hypothetical protein
MVIVMVRIAAELLNSKKFDIVNVTSIETIRKRFQNHPISLQKTFKPAFIQNPVLLAR